MASITQRVRTLFVLAIVGSSLALAAPTPASAAGTTITLDAPSGPVVTFEPIIFPGTVTPAGATTRVVLEQQVPGGWKDLAGVRPDADGSFELVWGTTESGTYTYRARSLHGTVVTDPIEVVVKPHPTEIYATAYPWRDVVAGQQVRISGNVIEWDATPRLVVQRRVNGRWSDRQSGPVDAGGHAAIMISPSQAGRYELRLRSAGGSRWSPSIFLDVAPKPIP